jgi:tight adherence protein B
MPIGIIVALVFLLTVAAVVGVSYLLAGRSQEALLLRSVADRLQEVAVGGRVPEAGADSLLRAQLQGPLPAVDKVARHALKGLAIERWLEQSGMRVSLGGVFLISLLLGVAAAAVATTASRMWWAGALAMLAGASMPFLVVRQKRASRLAKFEEQFPEALDLLSRAIRAGHAFGAGMKMVSEELGEPVGPEFRKAFEEQNYGLSLKESLNNLSLRVPLLDVRFFVTAVLIQKETGGNLSEILDSLAAVVRERFKIQRDVRTKTAHGRFTGYVLLALPGFLALALSLINPDHMDALFKERLGQMMIMATIVMQVVGWIWIKRIVKIEV